MNLGKKTTCGHCGAEFSFMLDKHDVEDCFDHLRAKVERLRVRAEDWRARFNSEAGLAGERQLEADEWRETARSEMAGRRAAEVEVERLRIDADHEQALRWLAEMEVSELLAIRACLVTERKKAEAGVERLREALKDLETVVDGVCDSGYSAGYVARTALRGGGEHSKHPTGDYCVYCLSQWPCVEAGEQ